MHIRKRDATHFGAIMHGAYFGSSGYPVCAMSDELAVLKRNQQKYLHSLAKLCGVALSTLAKDGGKAHTTVTRFANDANVPENGLNSATLFVIEQAAIRRLTKLLGELPTPDAKRRFAQDIQEFTDWAEKNGFAIRARLSKLIDGWTDNNQEIELNRVIVKAHIAAGEWREAIEWDDEGKNYTVWTPELGFDGLRRQGFEIRGTSMNLVYPDGTPVVCVSLIELGREPRNGEKVIVQRRRKDGLIEATCKEYQKADDGLIWLWPRSDDPLHQTPFCAQNPGPDIESIDITALVIFSVKREAVE
jgi:hypothetical protein